MDLTPVLDILSNPFAMAIILVLTIASTAYCWMGMRQKNMPMFLIGLGLGGPTFDIVDWRFWVASALVVAVGFWLKARTDSPHF